ncbi:hypothetical protein ACHAXN_006249 [Cyclotella atomus]
MSSEIENASSAASAALPSDSNESRDVEMVDANNDDAPQDAAASIQTEPEFYIHIRGLVGPPITDDQRIELDEWKSHIFAAATSTPTVAPSEALLEMLGDPTQWQSVICPVIQSYIRHVQDSTRPFCHNTHPLPSSTLHLYYTALTRILKNHRSSSRSMLVLNAQFHKSLFSLCHFSLLKATHVNDLRDFDIRGSGSCPIVYYKLIEAFLQEMGNGNSRSSSNVNSSGNSTAVGTNNKALPQYLKNTLRQVQEMLLDSLWMIEDQDCKEGGGGAYYNSPSSSGPSFIEMINKLRERPSCWPLASLRELCPLNTGTTTNSTSKLTSSTMPSNIGGDSKEAMFVGYIIQKLLILIEKRASSLCRQLSLIPTNELSLSQAHDVKGRTMTLFTTILCYRIDMFFGRHPDQIMMCALYIVCSKMELADKIGLREIVKGYKVEKGGCLSEEVVMDILYRVKGCGVGGEEGNIVTFYNTVFVPGMKGLWGAFLRSFDTSEEEATEQNNTTAAISDLMLLGSA